MTSEGKRVILIASIFEFIINLTVGIGAYALYKEGHVLFAFLAVTLFTTHYTPKK